MRAMHGNANIASIARNAWHCPTLARIAPHWPAWLRIAPHCFATIIVAIVARQWIAMQAPTSGAPTIVGLQWGAMRDIAIHCSHWFALFRIEPQCMPMLNNAGTPRGCPYDRWVAMGTMRAQIPKGVKKPTCCWSTRPLHSFAVNTFP